MARTSIERGRDHGSGGRRRLLRCEKQVGQR